MKNPFSLEGKTILVTGASSGIGRAIAIEICRMGGHIVACGRNIEALNEVVSQVEGNAISFIGDLTDENVVSSLVDSIPVVDGVVLCAGKGSSKPFKFASREEFDDIFNINFFSQIELLRLLVRKKKIRHAGSVVFMLSIGGTKRFTVGNSIYGSSKAALKSMVNYCAHELSFQKIRVNGICPGMVETPLIRRGALTEEQMLADMETYLLKRYGTPEDIAYGAIYLLSDASSWVTGHSLVIDGGVTAK